MPGTFTLDGWYPPVPVELAEDLTKEQLLEFRAFTDWLKTLQNSFDQQKFSHHTFHQKPFSLRHIKIQAFDRFDTPGRIYFMKLFATVENEVGEFVSGVVFLRGGSVAILMILRPIDKPDERWVIMTEQPRVAAGSLQFMEIPAGMLDDSKNFAGAAARQIVQEVGLNVEWKDLKNMTELAMQGRKVPENLHNAMYPSPGGCDEFISIFLWEKEWPRLLLENLRNKLDSDPGGKAKKEKIIVRLMNYDDLLEVGARDGKTLAAWSLYEYLKRTGILDENSHETY
jgi:ADP-sugar diphosphatase